MREPFRAALHEFEQSHPGVHVDLVEMDDEVYQQMGLLTLFVGGTPPDVYFQWGGHLVRKYAEAGYALDLSAEFPPEERRRYVPSSWTSCTGRDGRIYMWPDTASITTVMWYRKSLFREAGVHPPATWDELLSLCERFKSRGLIPIAVGNRELWPGGNFAAYMIAQYAGVQRYNDVLGLRPGTRLDDPAFVRALDLLSGLQSRGYLNQGVNGVGTDDARSLLAQGKAAMHPIGDWLVSEADEADVADLDAFRLPPMPGQQGDPATLLALATGYMINRNTPHPEEARALLRHLTSDRVQQEWSRHGHLSAVLARGEGRGQRREERGETSETPSPNAERRTPNAEDPTPNAQRRLFDLLAETRATALAPDVGFNLEVSDAFLDAVSLVLGGRATAAQALVGAERQVRALRGR